MFKGFRKMYWKSRDHGHEIRFILVTEFFIGLLIAGALTAWMLIDKQHLKNQSDPTSEPVVSGSAVSGTSVSGTAVSGSGTGGDATSGSGVSADSISGPATAAPSASPDQTDDPHASGTPYDENPSQVITSTTVDGIDVSSMSQLLSFMSDSDYEELIHQVVALAKIHGSASATLLTDYQDIGETDFDVIKYVKLDDDTIISCNINLDRGGVGTTVSDKSLAKLKAEAKAKEKASGANTKKAKGATKKKSKHKSKKAKSKHRKHAKR
ncbi:MAG: hypothetical protein IJL75_03810 [Eubacterium sp.]|nr:hypothetical protein [Eubacterium sp.]